jgi:pSer/pThr/pTyr-binding forkhead associated (FHA) protein
VVVDEGSRNGTFLGDPRGMKITERELVPGDVIVLANDAARFRYEASR